MTWKMGLGIITAADGTTVLIEEDRSLCDLLRDAVELARCGGTAVIKNLRGGRIAVVDYPGRIRTTDPPKFKWRFYLRCVKCGNEAEDEQDWQKKCPMCGDWMTRRARLLWEKGGWENV